MYLFYLLLVRERTVLNYQEKMLEGYYHIERGHPLGAEIEEHVGRQFLVIFLTLTDCVSDVPEALIVIRLNPAPP